MTDRLKIAFGGGCHWCTEAVFQSIIGVDEVDQGYVASDGENSSFSEAVVLTYDPQAIELKILIEIHLRTHKSASKHSMRKKYRSAIYVYNEFQNDAVNKILHDCQSSFSSNLITVVLPFREFQPSRADIKNYYFKNPEKPFCERFIDPKLILLLEQFKTYVDHQKVKHLTNEMKYRNL